MTERLRLWWYNNVKRHWHNWRIRCMWRADPDRPRHCPQAGRITPETMEWARNVMASIHGETAGTKE